MAYAAIADSMGVSAAAVEELIGGTVPAGIAARLDATAASLQDFVDGGGSSALAARLGCAPETLQDVRKQLGRGGAIGLLIGLCVTRR